MRGHAGAAAAQPAASIPTTASRCSAATATARPRWRACSRRSCRRWRATITASGKMRVGYFTQYQVEELHGDDTPLAAHDPARWTGKTPGAVRAQLGRFGFSGDKATTLVGKLSGGERARLALALITRDAPHLLILDEPTNHLDVDAREALVQALNGYDGAVILVSHDRHMVELTADRLVLVENGGAADYAGSIDDYIDFVLGRNQPQGGSQAEAAKARPQGRGEGARRRARAQEGGRGGRSGERPARGAMLGARPGDVRSRRRGAGARVAADERTQPPPRQARGGAGRSGSALARSQRTTRTAGGLSAAFAVSGMRGKRTVSPAIERLRICRCEGSALHCCTGYRAAARWSGTAPR